MSSWTNFMTHKIFILLEVKQAYIIEFQVFALGPTPGKTNTFSRTKFN